MTAAARKTRVRQKDQPPGSHPPADLLASETAGQAPRKEGS